MKRTFRNAIAMILALVIACGSLTAFAQTPGDIEWYFSEDSEPWIYSYAGEIEAGGEATLPPVTTEEYLYLTMDVEEEGYYKIEVDSDCWHGIQEIENGVCKFTIDSMMQDYNLPTVYYLEAGEYIIGFDLYEEKAVKVSTESLGDIVALEFDRSELEDRIMYYNIFEGLDGSYLIGMDSIAVEFGCGEKIAMNWASLSVYTDKELVKGENAVEIGLYGAIYREDATISLIDINDLIASVEVSNLDYYTNLTCYYNGDVYAPFMEEETVTITYTDGTTETLTDFSGWADLEKYGYPVEVFYNDESGEWELFVIVAGQIMVQKECTLTYASASENLVVYRESVVDNLSELVIRTSEYIIDILNSDSAGEAITALINAVKQMISDIIYVFKDVFRNTAGLFGSLI